MARLRSARMYVFDSNLLLIVALFQASLSAVLPLLPPPALLRTLLRHQHLLRIDGGDEVVGALLPLRREPGAKTIFPTKISKDISKKILTRRTCTSLPSLGPCAWPSTLWATRRGSGRRRSCRAGGSPRGPTAKRI